MKFVIFAALVVALKATCPKLTTVPEGYALANKEAAACTSGTKKAAVPYVVGDITLNGGAAPGPANSVTCASGYKGTVVSKADDDTNKCALDGCTKMDPVKAKSKCPAKTFPAADGKNAEIAAPECKNGGSAWAACKKDKTKGTYKVTCTGNADGTTAGTWSDPAGSCTDAAWVKKADANQSYCPLAKPDVKASTISLPCSTGKDADCPADGQVKDFACLGGESSATAPTCATKALNDKGVGICVTEADKACGAEVEGYVCNCANKGSAAGIAANPTWGAKPAAAKAVPGNNCVTSTPADGSGVAGVSKFLALLAAVAYMW